jgi:predicted transcriptional regulator
VPKATLLATTLQTLARVFAGGSRQELVMQLMETSDLKPDDLKLLQQAAAGTQTKSPKGKTK